MVSQHNCIKMQNLEHDVSKKISNVQKCLKCSNPFASLLVVIQLLLIVIVILWSCAPGEDQFYVPNEGSYAPNEDRYDPNQDSYEFIEQMRKTLVTHEMAYTNNLPYEEKYEPLSDSVLETTRLLVRKSPVKLTYGNGDIKNCNIFDSKIRTSGFIIICDSKKINVKDWGKYNMVFGNKEKCFQAILYNDQYEKISLETGKDCSNMYQIFERYTTLAHVTMDVETLTKQGYRLESKSANSLVLRYHTDNPARWVLEERYKAPRNANGKTSTDSVLYETPVTFMKIHTKKGSGFKFTDDTCLGIEFRVIKPDNNRQLFYKEISEQCTAMARLYTQSTVDISHTYTFGRLLQVEGLSPSTSADNEIDNIPKMFQTETFVFNFDELNGTPKIFLKHHGDSFMKVSLNYVTVEDLRANPLQDKYCFKMVIKYKNSASFMFYHERFCEQLFVDTAYFHNKIDKYGFNRNPSRSY